MNCPKCHDPNPDGGQFCRRCGGPLLRSSRGRMVAALVAALIVGALVVVVSLARSSSSSLPAAGGGSAAPVAAPGDAAAVVHVGVAFGTEKRDWFTWAVDAFGKTPEARGIQIDLKPMGSLEAAQAIVRGDSSIQVWSPASALYKDVFLRDWAAAHPGENPIVSEQQLALTPMVFVMWQQRYDAFVRHYAQVDFRTIASAMEEPGGWNVIANQPDWGFFKFSHTHPNRSNSGLVALVLMAYDYHATHRSLSQAQITDPAFQKWLVSTEANQVGADSGLIDSTGTLMNAMVQRGWSTYDCVMVYESNAVDRLRQANGRWGPLRVVYPARNFWNDHPFYVLNTPREHARPARRGGGVRPLPPRRAGAAASDGARVPAGQRQRRHQRPG